MPDTYDAGTRAFHSDAVVSDLRDSYFTMTFADCVPVLLSDRRLGVVGAVHAGWRGSALGIAGHTVHMMIEHFGSRPEDIVAGIGPSIGPCCYEVDRDVAEAFGPDVTAGEGARRKLDLWLTNRNQLLDAGIAEHSIQTAGICTSCHVCDFYSHRAEGGRTGRFALCIGLS